MQNMILITGAERSGSSIVAKVFSMCGAFGGDCNQMNENISIKALHHLYIDKKSDGCHMVDLSKTHFKGTWNDIVMDAFYDDGMNASHTPFYKDSAIAQTWQLWGDAFKDAKWIIVRRRTGDVIESCIQTAYMLRFKKETNRKIINVTSERNGWLWWVHQYEERFIKIIEKYPDNYRIVWPEKMAIPDFTQMQEAIEWAGLQWNPEIEKTIPSLLRKP